VALSKVAQEACWLRSLYSELGLLQEVVPTLILGNNKGLIAIGSFKVTIIDPIIGSIIFTIMLFLEPIFD